MKKSFIYALLSAIALTGTVSFSACSSSDELTDNPNFDPESNKVKTEFVINVTQPNERANSRMTDVNAGANGFQGIENMHLMCFSGKPSSEGNNTIGNRFDLTSSPTPTIAGAETNSSSKVYTLYIPTGTTNFLFYATALGTVTDKFAQGSLTKNYATATTVATDPVTNSDIRFNLESIASASDLTGSTGPQTKLLTILNDIVAAQAGTKTWASTSGSNDTQWKALGSAFNQFTNQANTSTTGDVRQGSSDAVLYMVSDLFDAVNDVYTNEADASAKALARAVLEQIYTYFNVTRTGETTFTYSWSSSPKQYRTETAFNSDATKYPEAQNLPAGSAVLVYNVDASGKFSYINNGTMGTSAAVSTACDNFTYPSQLTYYCNSGLWQTTIGRNNTTDWPNTSSTWLTYNWSTNNWDNRAVSAATRAVAMQDNITYGAAQLVSTIKMGDGVGSETKPLVDNADVVTGHVVPNNSFNGTAGKDITLKVHGMLIGAQPDYAQYEYLPLGNNFNKVIYDRFSVAGNNVTTTGVLNYTLALDNHTTSGDQSTVNVAFEMTADKDFYGATGKIKAGQKFYLIGALNPTSADGAITWTDHTSFKSGDRGQGIARVFIRDAKTVATFTLGDKCLQCAYSTIPDLRSTQMLFGISVDLHWKTGLTFTETIGG